MMFFRIVRFPDNGWCIAQFFDVAIEAVFSNIQFTPFKPFYFRFGKIPIQYVVPFFLPLKIGSNFGPEFFGLFNAFFIGLLVLR
jgi:hypothetical protein